MVGHGIGQVTAAEPEIGQVQMHLLAEPSLGPDAKRIAQDQHPVHQLGIDRGPACRAAERREMPPHVAEIDEPVHGAQQMIRRDMILNRERVEQRAPRHPPRPHHRHVSLTSREVKPQPKRRSTRAFQYCRLEGDAFGSTRKAMKTGCICWQRVMNHCYVFRRNCLSFWSAIWKSGTPRFLRRPAH